MHLVAYRGEPVAVVVNGDLAILAPGVEALGPGDPLRRFIAAMCRLAMELELGLVEGEYDDERAEDHARELLMPADEFAALGSLPNTHLGSWFGVPLEQVVARRSELGLRAGRPHHAEKPDSAA